MPSAFGEGFARAEETKFNTQMLLEQRLINAKQHQCLSKDMRNNAYWSNELNRLRVLYKEKVGVEYYEPPCSAILNTDAGTN